MVGDNLAWIITCDRRIQKVSFNTTEIQFPGYIPIIPEGTGKLCQLLPDASQMVDIGIIGTEVRVQKTDLLSIRDDGVLEIGGFIFLTKDDFASHHPLCLSANFNTFAIGPTIYTVGRYSASKTLKLDLDFPIVPRDSGSKRDFECECSISCCGRFVAFYKPAYKHFDDRFAPHPARCEIFKIDPLNLTSKRLEISFPNDLAVASLDFHHALPLAALSWHCGLGRDCNQTSQYYPSVLASEIYLAYVHLEEERVEEFPPLQFSQTVISELRFSECGTFTYLRGSDAKNRIIVSRVPYNPEPRRLEMLTDGEWIHPSLDRSYLLSATATDVKITMYQFTSDNEDLFPRLQTVEKVSTVNLLTVYPSGLGWNPDAWLLLDNYAESMKFLLKPTDGRPHRLKRLVFSWDQVRERLESTLKAMGS